MFGVGSADEIWLRGKVAYHHAWQPVFNPKTHMVEEQN